MALSVKCQPLLGRKEGESLVHLDHMLDMVWNHFITPQSIQCRKKGHVVGPPQVELDSECSVSSWLDSLPQFNAKQESDNLILQMIPDHVQPCPACTRS